MTIQLIDAEARERIRSALDESLLVEAGAGTGKTTVLVARLVEVLRRGHATVDDLVVITFTEKAATELGARVREGLEKARAQTGNEQERERLRTALRGLYRARIETIHAFAASLLHERPVESPVDPGLCVLDDVAASLLFSDVYDDWFGQLLTDERPELVAAVRRGFDTTHMRQLADVLHAQRAALPMRPLDNDRPDAPAFVAAVGGVADTLRAEIGSCTDHSDLGFLQAQRLIEWADALLGAAGDQAEIERRVLFRRPNVRKRCGSRGNWSDDASLAAVRTAAESLADEVSLFAGALRAEVLADLVPLAERFVVRYAARRRADGVADFDDLLVWARDLLRNPEVQTYFHRRYTCVLIDEFQDTDPVQAELARLLTDTDGDGVPEPGRLVVVGDPKQSIYRFRRADIAVYDDVKFGALAAGHTQIQQNFRSVDGILDWINAVFDTAFGAGKRGEQPPHVALLPVRRTPAGARAPVVVVHGDGQALKADDVRRQEAERIAATLDLAVRTDPWTVADPQTGEPRDAEWRDCVILLPARTGIDFYIDALTARGIPHRAETRGAFFGTQEVRELISMLQAIDDPTDVISIVATLRSRAFGCSDDDLLTYSVAAGGRIDYRGKDADQPAAVVEALAILRNLHRQRRGLSLAELVRRAIEDAAFVEFALARENGTQVAANVLKVADQARAFTVSGGGGLRAFTRWLSQQQDEEAGESEASVSEETDDLVRLMTIHAAKGLEYPIVVAANTNTGERKPEGPFSDPSTHRVAFRLGTQKTGQFATPDFDDWADREKAQLAAERLRLLYVALTRARDHLVIPCIPPPEKRGGLLAELAKHFPELDDETRGRDIDGVHVLDPATLPPLSPREHERIDELTEAEIDAGVAELETWVAARAGVLHSASAGLNVVTASSVKPIDRAFPLASTADAGDAAISLDLAPPVDIGTAVHRVMELITLPNGDDIEAITAAVCAEAGIGSCYMEVLELARRCLAAPSVQRALSADRYEREVPFAAVLDDGLQLVGRMDLVLREGDELVVVDFKTDAVVTAAEADAAAAAHSGQAAAYAQAVERATRLAVREVVFVFARAAVERHLPREQLKMSFLGTAGSSGQRTLDRPEQ
ncbi:MAG: UvrD-helicase domain-containing protein [Solirubrobacteraceae bacterium]